MRLPLALLALATSLVVSSTAQAETFCVHGAGFACPAGATDAGTNLQGAVSDAAGNATADTVVVGPGNFAGPIVANGAVGEVLVGSGSTTVITAPASGVTLTANAAWSVSGLRVNGAA